MAARQMRNQTPGITLQATALVNEAFLKMSGGKPPTFSTENEFVAFASLTMRSIVVDHARRKTRLKRQARGTRIFFEDVPAVPPWPVGEILDVNEALDELAREGEESARAAQVMELRYFCGLSDGDIATILGVSVRSVERDWHYARLWFLERLG